MYILYIVSNEYALLKLLPLIYFIIIIAKHLKYVGIVSLQICLKKMFF